jgi:hypothetical protein
MNVSEHQNGTLPSQATAPQLGSELSRLTHGLMGSISALVMCEHMISKELAPTDELALNPTLQTTLSLLKETADQIREYGDGLMSVSQRYRKIEQAQA